MKYFNGPGRKYVVKLIKDTINICDYPCDFKVVWFTD